MTAVVSDSHRDAWWAERAPDGSHWRVHWRAGFGLPRVRCVSGALSETEVEAYLHAYADGFEDGYERGRAAGQAALAAELRRLLGTAADEARTGLTSGDDCIGAVASEARSL